MPDYGFIEDTKEYKELNVHYGITNFFKVSAESAKKRNLKCFYFVWKMQVRQEPFARHDFVRGLWKLVSNYIFFHEGDRVGCIKEEVLGQYWWVENEEIATNAFKNSLEDYEDIYIPLGGYKIEPVIVDLTKLDFTKKYESEKAFGEYVVSQYKEIEPFKIYREGDKPNGQEKETDKEEKKEEKS